MTDEERQSLHELWMQEYRHRLALAETALRMARQYAGLERGSETGEQPVMFVVKQRRYSPF
jgi:hypothetical protein